MLRSVHGMRQHNGVGSQLRKLFRNVPEAIMPKPERPRLLTDDDARLNYGSCLACLMRVFLFVSDA